MQIKFYRNPDTHQPIMMMGSFEVTMELITDIQRHHGDAGINELADTISAAESFDVTPKMLMYDYEHFVKWVSRTKDLVPE